MRNEERRPAWRTEAALSDRSTPSVPFLGAEPPPNPVLWQALRDLPPYDGTTSGFVHTERARLHILELLEYRNPAAFADVVRFTRSAVDFHAGYTS